MAYTITIIRYVDFGTMIFATSGVAVVTSCWWDPKHKIDANLAGYPGWATHMNTKKDSKTGKPRPAIWLGKGVPFNNGAGKTNGIFIHEGKNAAWSDGCIVANREEVLKIWNAIPQGAANALVKVIDLVPTA